MPIGVHMRKHIRAVEANWYQLRTASFVKQLCYQEALLQLATPTWLPETNPRKCLWDTENGLLYKIGQKFDQKISAILVLLLHEPQHTYTIQ